jgi:hypothetical protein
LLKNRRILRVLIYTFIFTQLGMASVFVGNELLHATSSNSVVYFVRGETGGVKLTRDLFLEDAEKLIFMIDFNGILARLRRELAVARHRATLELTWDKDEGVGNIKQFRPDGSVLSLAFSRYRDEVGRLQGLFLGGELSFGDTQRSKNRNSSGFGYFDGDDWHHIWCSSNEGFSIAGTNTAVVPSLWKYTGSRVLKDTEEEVILESSHEVEVDGSLIYMKRYVSIKAEKDYFVLKVKFINASPNLLAYNYAYGDEPWVGDYENSRGDVGWYGGGLVMYEKFISPSNYSYAGFWDIGNEAAGEDHTFSRYANFIEWTAPTPSYVFFSNSFEKCCDESASLSDDHKRVLDVVWFNQNLLPGESKSHTLVLGMAEVDPSSKIPVKPEVDF